MLLLFESILPSFEKEIGTPIITNCILLNVAVTLAFEGDVDK